MLIFAAAAIFGFFIGHLLNLALRNGRGFGFFAALGNSFIAWLVSFFSFVIYSEIALGQSYSHVFSSNGAFFFALAFFYGLRSNSEDVRRKGQDAPPVGSSGTVRVDRPTIFSRMRRNWGQYREKVRKANAPRGATKIDRDCSFAGNSSSADRGESEPSSGACVVGRMVARNHYQNLGVDSDASLEEIKEAHDRASREWNPERHPNDRDMALRRLKAANIAYDVLSDPDRRRRHDEWIKING